MKSAYLFILTAITMYVLTMRQPMVINDHSDRINSPPKVKIVAPGDNAVFAWNAQVRYSISISDSQDGESKYGEIKPNESLLEIEYLPVKKGEDIKERIKKAQSRQEHTGLTLMKTSTCFGCHADKSRLSGPSFSEIAGRYKYNASAVKNLADHIIKGSSGIWGNLQMPAHPDLTQEEAGKIAAYIFEQGANKTRWIYPGLEGAFQIVGKPQNETEGVYILTASYTSKAKLRGQHSILLKIK